MSQSRIRSFASELRRRKVWQVAALHGAAAAGAIALADEVVPAVSTVLTATVR